MERISVIKKIMIAGAFAASSAVMLTACSGGGTGTTTESKAKIADTLSSYPKSDMSGYEGLQGYDKETVFVDMTVQDVKKEMDNSCPCSNYLLCSLRFDKCSGTLQRGNFIIIHK